MSLTSPIEHLAAGLQNRNPTIRYESARGLAQLAWGAQAAAVPLVVACRHDDDARKWALAALQQMGPPDPADVHKLADLLRDPAPLVASWAATLLGRLGPRAASSATSLAHALAENADLHVREQAAWALGRMGPGAHEAAPALQKAASCEQSRLARVAERALRNIQDEVA